MKALHALEGVAVEMSKEREIRFSHKCIPYPHGCKQITATGVTTSTT